MAEVARTHEWLASQRTAAPASGTGGSLSLPASGGATVVRFQWGLLHCMLIF